jgi:hypothetical protein
LDFDERDEECGGGGCGGSESVRGDEDGQGEIDEERTVRAIFCISSQVDL